MRKPNHVCVVCGTPYYACNSCEQTKRLRPWQTFTHSLDCYKIYLILRDYRSGVTDRKQAREQLKGLNLENWKDFKPGVVKVLSEILPKARSPKKVEYKFDNENENI